jgi:hypothetical protein
MGSIDFIEHLARMDSTNALKNLATLAVVGNPSSSLDWVY